jgi:hypothetical protein
LLLLFSFSISTETTGAGLYAGTPEIALNGVQILKTIVGKQKF